MCYGTLGPGPFLRPRAPRPRGWGGGRDPALQLGGCQPTVFFLPPDPLLPLTPIDEVTLPVVDGGGCGMSASSFFPPSQQSFCPRGSLRKAPTGTLSDRGGGGYPPSVGDVDEKFHRFPPHPPATGRPPSLSLSGSSAATPPRAAETHGIIPMNALAAQKSCNVFGVGFLTVSVEGAITFFGLVRRFTLCNSHIKGRQRHTPSVMPNRSHEITPPLTYVYLFKEHNRDVVCGDSNGGSKPTRGWLAYRMDSRLQRCESHTNG